MHFFNAGTMYARLGRPAEAERAFKETIALAPARPEGYAALAEFFLRAGGDRAAALAAAARARELDPDNPRYEKLLVDIEQRR
jgi:tetratricopeptide (TPR) repeat protein